MRDTESHATHTIELARDHEYMNIKCNAIHTQCKRLCSHAIFFHAVSERSSQCYTGRCALVFKARSQPFWKFRGPILPSRALCNMSLMRLAAGHARNHAAVPKHKSMICHRSVTAVTAGITPDHVTSRPPVSRIPMSSQTVLLLEVVWNNGVHDYTLGSEPHRPAATLAITPSRPTMPYRLQHPRMTLTP